MANGEGAVVKPHGGTGMAPKRRKPAVLSAGVVVVRRHRQEYRFLLLRAYRYWDFPKGRVEVGEHALDAARREVNEETTLSELEFRWNYDFHETPPYGRGKVARYYLAESPAGEVSLPVNPVLGQPEHHEFRWLGYAAARRLLNPRLQIILDWAHAVITGG